MGGGHGEGQNFPHAWVTAGNNSHITPTTDLEPGKLVTCLESHRSLRLGLEFG